MKKTILLLASLVFAAMPFQSNAGTVSVRVAPHVSVPHVSTPVRVSPVRVTPAPVRVAPATHVEPMHVSPIVKPPSLSQPVKTGFYSSAKTGIGSNVVPIHVKPVLASPQVKYGPVSHASSRLNAGILASSHITPWYIYQPMFYPNYFMYGHRQAVVSDSAKEEKEEGEISPLAIVMIALVVIVALFIGYLLFRDSND